ncbi:MAG: hypothetical protein Q9179_005283 [Wetmoreana sp. 5 TL-2023]
MFTETSMPLKSPFSIPIPTVSIPTFVFGSLTSALPNEPLLLSTTNPSSSFLTLSSYRSLSQHFAAGLKARHDLKAGERVLLASPNSIYTAVVFMGTIMAGGIFVGAQHSFDVHDLSRQIEQTEPRVLLMSEDFRELLQQAVGMVRSKDWDMGDETAFAWHEFHSTSEAQQIASLIYSSGTSGQPKGVELTHHQLIAGATQKISSQKRELPKHSTSTNSTKSSPPLVYMSMAQIVGQMAACVVLPSMRRPVYIAPKMDFVSVADNVIELGITNLIIHPGFMLSLMKEDHMRARLPKMGSLRELVFVGSPVDEEACSQFQAVWEQEVKTKMRIRFAYGMTELGGGVMDWDLSKHGMLTSIELRPEVEVKIMNLQGSEEMSDDEEGELWVRGPNDMLRLGDTLLAPFYMERALLKHPYINEAVICSVEKDFSTTDGCPARSHRVRTYIIKKDDKGLSETQVIDFLGQNYPELPLINGGVVFVDRIPKTTNHKPRRQVLLAQDKTLDLRL